jgi:hypothetical protein
MIVVFAVRLAGQLHPQIFIVDLLFHVHRFETVQSGTLLFTIESAEWGGRSTFYLPTPYMMMVPLQWLLNDELLVVKLFTVVLSTLGAFPVYLIGLRAAGSRAGLLASALYLSVPIAVLPFSWGITSNVFGEFFALCALAVIVLCYPNLSPRGAPFWVLLVSLSLALLSHPGVVQLTGLAFALMGAIMLTRRGRENRLAGAWALGALATAAVLAFVLYYRHFAADMLRTLQEIRAERAAQASPGSVHLKIGGSVADKSLGLIVRYVETRREWLFGGLRGFWQEAQAYYRVWPVAGAIVGYGWLSLHARARVSRSGAAARALILAALGWGIAVLAYAVVGWTVNLYVRYALFALPVIALGSGVLLALVSRRGKAGALTAVLVLLFFAVEAVALWHFRITYAFK